MTSQRAGWLVAIVGAIAFAVACANAQPAAFFLPNPPNYYYSTVRAAFGELAFSLHYEEYANISGQVSVANGRYYSPFAVEWVNVPNNLYQVQINTISGTNGPCNGYHLANEAPIRLLRPSASLITALGYNITFHDEGETVSIRNQDAVHFQTTVQWTSANIISEELNEIVQVAYAMAGRDTTSAYAVSATIHVYYVSDQYGNPTQIADGYVPLRYIISGTRTDSVNGQKVLNIQYDFMQFSAMNFQQAQSALAKPSSCPTSTGLAPSLGPAGSLKPANTTALPLWLPGVVAVEIQSSTNASLAVHALQDVENGQEKLNYLQDPNQYWWTSELYEYDSVDERDFEFAAGAVYTLNYTLLYGNSQYYLTPCQGAQITPSTESPLQWTVNAPQLSSFFVDQKDFLKGATYMQTTVIDGFSADVWSLNRVSVWNGELYQYNYQLYFLTNGWANLGTTQVTAPPQLLRMVYNGTKTSAKGGNTTPYWVVLDFYLQYHATFETWYLTTLDPTFFLCTIIDTGLSILPIMPPQYAVSVSASITQYAYSSQYTEYVDTQRNLRRVDGRFAAPNAFTVLSPGTHGSNSVSMEAWTQSVTLAAGFSGLTLYNSAPYTVYQPSQVTSDMCGAMTVDKSEFAQLVNLNFFDLLAQADASLAVYVATLPYRGVMNDAYILNSFQYTDGDNVAAVSITIFYLASNDNLLETIPITAGASFQFQSGNSWELNYDFYNFRTSLPANIFSVPAASTCTGNIYLPAPVPTVYNNGFWPSPNTDGTPKSPPAWPTQFSVLIEGQLFLQNNDQTMYTARWYADFANGRERIDIEPAFNVSNSAAVQGTYIYYYNQPAGSTVQQLSFTSGTFVSYNGGACVSTAITSSNMNPLKQVPPGNLFDGFFPPTAQSISSKSTLGGSVGSFNGFPYVSYSWADTTTFGPQNYQYTLTKSIFLTVTGWINNPQAGNYSQTRVPVNLQAIGSKLDQNGVRLGSYSPSFRMMHYQAGNPGAALFDTSLLGCGAAQTSTSSSSNTSLIIGVVVGVGGAIVVIFVAYFIWRRGSLGRSSYGGGKNGGGDNELVGVGKMHSDEGAENSLNKLPVRRDSGSLNVKPAETGVEVETAV